LQDTFHDPSLFNVIEEGTVAESKGLIELDYDGYEELPADRSLPGGFDKVLKPHLNPKIGTAILVTLALSPALSLNARAQQVSPAQCWDIVSPNSKEVSYAPILIDKCTGKSWFLAKVTTQGTKADAPGTYVYRWRPITMDDVGETTFTMPLR
jgi:hypothetical protein